MTLEYSLKHHPKTHLIFDFDETLFWLVLRWEKFDEVVRKLLTPIDAKLAADYASGKTSLSDTFNAYFRAYGKRAKKIVNEQSVVFEKRYLDRAEPNTKLLEFVRANAGNYHMSIWTSNTSEIVKRVLAQHKLTHAFEKIASQLEVRLVKPEPDGFYYLQQNGVPLKNYLMVGNSRADHRAATAAGIDFFHIDYFTKHPRAD